MSSEAGSTLDEAGAGSTLAEAGAGSTLDEAGTGGGNMLDEAEAGTGGGNILGEAARARVERQRQRARALRAARLAPSGAVSKSAVGTKLIDGGGGFLLEEESACPRRAVPPSAPRLYAEPCLECARPIASSYLLDHFDYAVCDDCRDEEGIHALVARTQAKAEFLLKDCDLDSRGGALPYVSRVNPHRAHGAPMRLYLRAQLRARALDTWGGDEQLQAERERRAARGEAQRAARYERELRALRLAVRGAPRQRDVQHEHEWQAETYDEAADTYSRTCSECRHTQTYEKM